MDTKKTNKYFIFIVCFFCCVLLWASYLQKQNIGRSLTSPEISASSKESLIRKQSLVDTQKNIFEAALSKNLPDSLFAIFDDKKSRELEAENISINIYRNDTLIFWSSNKTNFSPVKTTAKNKQHYVIKLQNGWYFVQNEKVNNYQFISLIKVKNEFSVENNFLENEYLLVEANNQNIDILLNAAGTIGQVTDGENNYLFSFKSHQKTNIIIDDIFSFVLLFVGLILLIFFIKTIAFASLNYTAAFIFFSSIILLLRAITIFYAPNFFWYGHEFFSPINFAEGLINASLGDYLLNAIVIYSIVLVTKKTFSFPSLQKLKQIPILIILIGLSVVCSFVFSHYVSVLITDSNINYNFSNFAELKTTSFIAIIIMAFLCIIYFEVFASIAKKITSIISVKEITLLFVSLIFIWLVLLFAQYNLAASNFFFVAISFLLFYIFNHATFINTTYSKMVFFISLFALWSSTIINSQLIYKNEQKAKLLAEKLSIEKDVVAENLFADVSTKISSDSLLTNYLFGAVQRRQLFFKRLNEKYFNGYWDKFDMRMYVYDVACNIVAKSANAADEKLTVFEEVCSKKELLSSAANLYYVPTENDEDAGLLCKISFKKMVNNKEVIQTLYIQFTIKYNADEIGFPSLLLDKKIGHAKDKFNDFSYTKYRYNLLIPIGKNSSFSYPLNANFLSDKNVSNQIAISDGFFNFNDFRHYYYKPYKTVAYIVSFKYLTLLEKLTSSSYLFAIYILLFSILYIVTNSQNLQLPKLETLNKKIRVVLIGSVLSVLIVLAAITTYFLISHFNSDKKEKLTENIQSLLIELENKFGDETQLSQQNAEYYNYLLSKSSNVFFNEINMYDLGGNLIASSRVKIFDEGIMNTKMDAQAFQKLKYKNEVQFIHTENIGNLSYISVYIPFVNNKNNLIGYINLPFFDKENLLNKDIFNLLATILNLYLLLFVFIAVVAWWMTNKITFPLTLLKQRFADIDLGKSNAVIEWKQNDEIGSVVKEYNNMVVQLNESAAKLAQNERELAWREMAKQVAHEIKNPLTPMKLNVQLLQRNIKLDDKLFKQKFEKVADSLIEQIDSLANIANDFANFAQISKNNPEKLNLEAIIDNVISLYKSEENIIISFSKPKENISITADKDHWLRVLNNLVKNAIQALYNVENAKIDIVLSSNKHHIILTISDNGNGIPNDIKGNIFKPYFTTKSSGTGLGLAMVHQLIESMNGTIHFENILPQGTKFIININKQNNDSNNSKI